LENSSYRVKYRIFDSFDGFSGKFSGTATNHREIQGTDGKLWFSASGSLSWIDPANILTNALPPTVSIRSVTANGRQAGSVTNLALPQRTTELQIDYTALSLAVPEKVRFRYKLDGVNQDWQDAGTRREAFYTGLGPGKYHFRVMACNNDGVWNETGASLNFTIAPAWNQTIWFEFLIAVAALALVWTVYTLRLRQVTARIQERLGTRMEERERIARELHDTLLQSFQGLTLQFQRARNLLPDRTTEAIQTLDTALNGAEEAIVEGRDAIHDLRSPITAAKALAEEIKRLGEELVPKGTNTKDPVEFRLLVEGSARPMRPNLHIEVFRIAREALRNAFSHSQGNLIETELAYTEKLFRLRVRDDGKGINLDERARAERTGHWGLKGMRERTEHLGGELEVWSEPGAGTEIELRVPASIAYETPRSQGSSWLFWRRRNNP
jgi:signal transduction histidine kinase